MSCSTAAVALTDPSGVSVVDRDPQRGVASEDVTLCGCLGCRHAVSDQPGDDPVSDSSFQFPTEGEHFGESIDLAK